MRRLIVLPEVVYVHDVGVTEPGERAGFLHEPCPHEFVAAEARTEDLDRDPSPEALVLGEEDPGHAAGPDLADDPVARESFGHRFPYRRSVRGRLFTGNQIE